MKKYLTIILALIAVAAIVVSCVFGVQKGDLQKKYDDLEAQLKTKGDELTAVSGDLENAKAAAESVKTELEAAKAEVESAKAEVESVKAQLEAAKTEADSVKADLEAKLNQAERNLTAAKSNAYIMYANADWSVSNWGTFDSEDGNVKVTPAAVTGEGDYTIGLEFANESAGLAFTAIGIKNGEIDFPGYYIRLNEIRVNGEKIETAVGYTSSDDGKETRMNLYNEWVSELPSDARVFDGNIAEAKPVIVDKEAFAAVKTVEIDFSVLATPLDHAYIMYANADWSVSNWGIEDSEDGNVKVKAAEIRGAGDYTVGLEFANEAEGLAFTALGIVRGEKTFPNYYITINEIRVNGAKIEALEGKKGYTSSDDGITTRMNLYNEWVTDLPEDARSLDGDLSNAAPIFVDKAAFDKVKSIEIDFSYNPVSAYLMYANGDWSISNWGYTSSDAVKVIAAPLNGEGNYTVGLEFAEPAEGLAFTAVGIKNGETVLPNYIIKIDSVTINDGDNIVKGINFTNSDDGKETRANIYNEWVTDLPEDARNEEGNLDNASAVIVDKELFTGVSKVLVNFHLVKGKEIVAAADDGKMTKEQIDELKANGFNAYIGVQTKSYIFRNTWDEAKYGRDAEDGLYFKRLTGWDADNNAVDYGGTFQDVEIKANGEYTVSLTTGDMGFGTDDTFRMLFASTTIPSELIKDGYVTIEDVKTKIGSAATQKYTDVDTSGDYARIVVIDEYNRSSDPFGYTVPGANETISITFTVGGMAE